MTDKRRKMLFSITPGNVFLHFSAFRKCSAQDVFMKNKNVTQMEIIQKIVQFKKHEKHLLQFLLSTN